MSRYTDPKCKLCRRAGGKLFLKGERCFSDKCAINRKPYPPGGTMSFSRRPSTYGTQLREKQNLKWIYGLTERQLKNIIDEAVAAGGDRGLKLLQLIEMRLDNVAYLLGIAPSRAAARQAVTHGKVAVNGKKMSIPSYTVSVGDVISVRDASFQTVGSSGLRTPRWLKKAAKGGEVIVEPTREMLSDEINENLVIEYYSR
jgi:small subunit ribosomal protein S4